jgi:hypothetical protein
MVHRDRLLVVKLEDGLGWKKICPFLGVDIPTVPYPRMNDTKQFQENSKRMAQKGQTRSLWLMGAMGAVAVGSWYIRR